MEILKERDKPTGSSHLSSRQRLTHIFFLYYFMQKYISFELAICIYNCTLRQHHKIDMVFFLRSYLFGLQERKYWDWDSGTESKLYKNVRFGGIFIQFENLLLVDTLKKLLWNMFSLKRIKLVILNVKIRPALFLLKKSRFLAPTFPILFAMFFLFNFPPISPSNN